MGDENVDIKQDLMRLNGLYIVFFNSFGDPCPLYKYDLLGKKKSCLLHNLLYMDVIFIFTFYLSYYSNLTFVKLIL
jgi:hypothetical protein